MNGKTIEKIVVPVECCGEQGTAFFIGERQLLTARHVVRGHFCDPNAPDPVFINICGDKLPCRAIALGGLADAALLTLLDDEPYVSKEYLVLLKDEFVPHLELKVYGYPQEVAMGVNLVALDVANRLEINDWNDRALVRRDQLHLNNYDGLSGSPVVNIEGRVIGVLTLQTNETLGYLSVAKMSERLDAVLIAYKSDWAGEDNTTFGQGRSTEICKKAIAAIRDRYMENMHQPNKQLEHKLDCFADKKSIDEKIDDANELIGFLRDLSSEEINKIRSIYAQPGKLNLKLFCRYVMAERFRSILSWEDEIKLNTLVRTLYNGNAFDYINSGKVKNLCLIGKAGAGKTHSLCEFASKKQHQANIYLFLGTGFVLHESVIEQIRNKVCEEKSFNDFDIELCKRGRYAIIVIDALNEGLGCGFWNNQLGSLREELNKYPNIKLVISVRNPFDRELNDLTTSSNNRPNWEIFDVKGFEDKIGAIDRFFKEYKIPDDYKGKHLEAFANPLFLRIFCETFHSMSKSDLDKLSRLTVYKKYVKIKNAAISEQVDEDVELNIADQYLMKLANYSVFHAHFNTISRGKAREYARKMCPYRLWSQDLLNATLSASLLLNDHSAEGSPAVMFEYENLGDYYKAEQLLQSKMDVDETLDWLMGEKKYFDKHADVASDKFENTITALFDCWNVQGKELEKNKTVQQQDFLREHYIGYLMGSDMDYYDVLDKLEELDPAIRQDLNMVRRPQDLDLKKARQIHEHLNSYETIGKRDLIWTNYINDIFENYGEDIIGTLPCEQNHDLPADDAEKVFLIRLGWLLTTSHPLYRALLIRKLRKLLAIHHEMIPWTLELFDGVKDPYVLQGLFCAVAGVLLTLRDKDLLSDTASYIYRHYYENPESVPQDLIIRQWTLKIIERAYNVDNKCDWWKKIKTPFKPLPFNEKDIPSIDSINRDFFGMQHGSQLLYESIFGFSDFNRYIIGTNNRSSSTDYFKYDEVDGKYVGDDLKREEAEIAYYIKSVFGWNDKLGFLDNGKYSVNRFQNDLERIGKKFQWLAWYRLNARLMDTYRVSRSSFHFSDKANEDNLAETPYPWYTSEVTCFDPTLDVESYRASKIQLKEMTVREVEAVDDDVWIKENKWLPMFRYQVKTKDDETYIMLYGFDKVISGNKITYVISNAAFLKKDDEEQFEKWCEKIDFYGRWMPERNGMYEFLWNDYPKADAYKNAVEVEAWERPSNGCPCDVMLSYTAQLQEHWEGIASNDEYLTTVFMPCEEVMEQQGLYCSEVRGIICRERDENIAAFNTSKEDGFTGLFIREDILDDYLKQNNYTLFYYVLGEKQLHEEPHHAVMKNLSAAYKYRGDGTVAEIQPMRIIEREIPHPIKPNPGRIAELEKKNNEEGLTTREVNELVQLKILLEEEDKEK